MMNTTRSILGRLSSFSTGRGRLLASLLFSSQALKVLWINNKTLQYLASIRTILGALFYLSPAVWLQNSLHSLCHLFINQHVVLLYIALRRLVNCGHQGASNYTQVRSVFSVLSCVKCPIVWQENNPNTSTCQPLDLLTQGSVVFCCSAKSKSTICIE